LEIGPSFCLPPVESCRVTPNGIADAMNSTSQFADAQEMDPHGLLRLFRSEMQKCSMELVGEKFRRENRAGLKNLHRAISGVFCLTASRRFFALCRTRRTLSHCDMREPRGAPGLTPMWLILRTKRFEANEQVLPG
jgi:hypothetical protein